MKIRKAIFRKILSYFNKFNFFKKEKQVDPFKSHSSSTLVSEGQIQIGTKLAKELGAASSEPIKQKLADLGPTDKYTPPFPKPNKENLLDLLSPEQIRDRSDLKLQNQILRERKQALKPVKQYSNEVIEELILIDAGNERDKVKVRDNDRIKAALREQQVEEQRKEILNEASEQTKAIMFIKKLFPMNSDLTEYEANGLNPNDPIKFSYKFNQWLNDQLGNPELSEAKKSKILCKEEFFYQKEASNKNTYNIIDLVYEKIHTEEGKEALGQLLLIYSEYMANNPTDTAVKRKFFSVSENISAAKDPVFLEELLLFVNAKEINLKNAFQENMYDLSKSEDKKMLEQKKNILIKGGVPENKINERLEEIFSKKEKLKAIAPKKVAFQDFPSSSREKKSVIPSPLVDNKAPHQILLDQIKNIPFKDWSKTDEFVKQIDQIIKTPNDYEIYPQNIFKEFAKLAQKLPIFVEEIMPKNREVFLEKVLNFKSTYQINSFNLFEISKSDIKSCKNISKDFQDKIDGLLILGYKPEELKKYVEKNEDVFKNQSNKNGRNPKEAINSITDLIDKKFESMAEVKLPKAPQFKSNNLFVKPRATPTKNDILTSKKSESPLIN